MGMVKIFARPLRGTYRARTRIDGARKVWGTHKSTTTGEVKGAISVLANIDPEDLNVKRKFKMQDSRSNVQRFSWWFVLRADESILRGLEESWNTLALPRRWKLKPLLSFMDNVETSITQETHPINHPDSNGPNGQVLPTTPPDNMLANQSEIHEQNTQTNNTSIDLQLVSNSNEQQTTLQSSSQASSNSMSPDVDIPSNPNSFLEKQALVAT